METSNRSNRAELLGFFGHHKCGSTWVYHVLRDIAATLDLPHLHAHGAYDFDRDLLAARNRHGFDLITYVNANYAYLKNIAVRGVHVVRDPRDVLVSAYFSHRHSHPTDGWPELAEFRPYLQSVSLESGLLLELDFCSGVMTNMMSWPRQADGILSYRFEDLIEDNRAGFRRILGHLDLVDKISMEDLDAIIDRWSFKKVSGGREPGETDSQHHYRKGVAGDWRHHFTPAVCWAFRRRYNELLLKLGYEENEEWSL